MNRRSGVLAAVTAVVILALWLVPPVGGGGGGVKVRVAGFVSRGSELSIFSTTD